MSIDCTKYVIEKTYITVLINCSSQLDALFLATTEVDPTLSYFLNLFVSNKHV